MKPFVSVVIPTYNRRALLAEAIDSVCAQRNVEVEIVVVDDASTDDTWSWLSTQNGVRAIRNERNARTGATRNAGLAVATADYVMFLDDDDVLFPDALSTLHRALSAEHTAVAVAGARWDWFVDEGRGRRDVHPRVKRVKNVFDEFLFGWSAIPSQTMFRSDAVRSIGGFSEVVNYVEDRDLWLRLSRIGSAVLVPDIVVKYRVLRGHAWPANIVELRERVAQHAIESLPQNERARAIRIRKAGIAINTADESLRARHYMKGFASVFKGLVASPQIFANPLIASWSLRRIIRATVRSVIPPTYKS